ncbi:MAG: hypothetical protein ACI9TH_003119 [Kiritimatiellia bacterium]|jgi:hypothetical protein
MNEASSRSNPELTPAPSGSAWLVLHARPRCEKKLSVVCRQHGITCYLPLMRKSHTYGARVRTFDVPMFSGYLFGIVDQQQKLFLEQNRLVANLLAVHDQEVLVRQLLQVDLALHSGEVLDVLPYLEEGRIVKIATGPFRGMEGVIDRIKGKSRVILNVDMIGQSIAVEIDSTYLSPA